MTMPRDFITRRRAVVLDPGSIPVGGEGLRENGYPFSGEQALGRCQGKLKLT